MLDKSLWTKQYCRKGVDTVVLIANHHNYSKSFDLIFAFAEELYKDFPILRSPDIVVVIYGGDRYKRMIGVEAHIPNDVFIPVEYKEIKELEFTL